MTTKRNENKEEDGIGNSKKTCFVIMPIADHPNYELGHFKRVYEHIVVPACLDAGYEPIRADENASSNMIMHDILLNIVRSEMVICDLSTNNANVFYELGLRQAFNKKTVLITDGREKTPFDLLGFRYQMYTPSLRIDTVTSEIKRISAALTATENLQPNEVNSIVKLLEIDSANIEIIQPNENQAFMLQMFNSLSAQIANIAETGNPSRSITNRIISSGMNYSDHVLLGTEQVSFYDIEANTPSLLYEYTYYFKNKKIGIFNGFINEGAQIQFKDARKLLTFNNSPTLKSQILTDSRL